MFFVSLYSRGGEQKGNEQRLTTRQYAPAHQYVPRRGITDE
jgi:hypothetical protein